MRGVLHAQYNTNSSLVHATLFISLVSSVRTQTLLYPNQTDSDEDFSSFTHWQRLTHTFLGVARGPNAKQYATTSKMTDAPNAIIFTQVLALSHRAQVLT